MSLTSHRFEPLEDLESPVRYRYEAEAPRFAQIDGAGLRVAVSVLGDLTSATARATSRRYPLDLGEPNSYRERRTVVVPRGMRVVGAPTDGVAESDFGRLSLRVERQQGRVVMRTEFDMNRDLIEPTDYEAFRAWVVAADQILRQQLVMAP